jgi:hypothetical protein
MLKKRVALTGRDKRAWVRALLAFKLNDKALFTYGFAKTSKAISEPPTVFCTLLDDGVRKFTKNVES